MFKNKINELSKIGESSIIAISNSQGLIQYINPQFTKTYGFEFDEVKNSSFKIIRNLSTPSFVYKQMWNNLLNHNEWSGILKNKTKNGNELSIKTKIIPFIHSDGLEYYLAISNDITKEIIDIESSLHYKIDKISGLHNRDTMINDALYRSEKFLYLAVFNIDSFKSINDYYGYKNGDILIKKVSEILTNQLYFGNLYLYHIAIDEFAILSFSNNLSEDKSIFKNLCKSILDIIEHSPIKFNMNIEISINLSVGISHGTDLWQVLKESDMALSYAKSEHKSLVDFNKSDKLNKDLTKKMFWLEEIKFAISHKKIVPWLQPIQDNKSNKIVKFEALMRLIDNNDSIITPFNFLDISKHTKYYEKMSLLMIDATLKYFTTNFDEFNINISWQDVKSKDINHMLINYLDEYDNLGERMTIELVEDESIENFNLFNDFILKMKNYGVKIALDDFGSGYSNFIYIDKIKAEYIKIDGTLITDMMVNDKTLFIVKSIVAIAKKFGIKTVAEFVETEQIYKKVKELDIDYSQGYFIGKPRPLNW